MKIRNRIFTASYFIQGYLKGLYGRHSELDSESHYTDFQIVMKKNELYTFRSLYFFGMFFRISTTYFQYFCDEEMLARSSGECAPRMFGPKLIISMSG